MPGSKRSPSVVCFCSKVGEDSSSRLARLAVLPLGRRWKRSSFFGLRRVDVLEVGVLLVVVLEVLMRELRVLVKARVVEEEISLPLVRLCGREL